MILNVRDCERTFSEKNHSYFAQTADPFTGASAGLTLHRFTSLHCIKITRYTHEPAADYMLRLLLTSWKPSTSTRHLLITSGAHLNDSYAYDVMVARIGTVGGIIEEHCSGTYDW